MLSKIEDVDYAEAITRLKSEESIYQATLAASSKIIQPSLMDFLR
jgi:flagellar hook-associated protein 3 FlgL